MMPTKPLIQWLPGTISPEIKHPWCEADHPLLSNATVKNVSSYNSTHPTRLHGTTSHTTQLLKEVETARKVNVHNFLFLQVNTLSLSSPNFIFV